MGNDKIDVRIAGDGALESVANKSAAETYAFSADGFSVDTDLGGLSSCHAKPVSVTADPRQVEFHYEFGSVGVDLVYGLKPGNGFFRRWLTIRSARPMRLKNLTLGPTTFASPARDVVHYVTFIAAPTVEFIRYDRGGLFTGIENPFFKPDLRENGRFLEFRAGADSESGRGIYQRVAVYRRVPEVRRNDRGQRPRVPL